MGNTNKEKYLRGKCLEVVYAVKLLEWYKVPEDSLIFFRLKINGFKAHHSYGALLGAYNMEEKIPGPYFVCRDIHIPLDGVEDLKPDNELTRCLDRHSQKTRAVGSTWKDVEYNTCAKVYKYCAPHRGTMKFCCPETCELCPSRCDKQDGTTENAEPCVCGDITCNHITGLYCHSTRRNQQLTRGVCSLDSMCPHEKCTGEVWKYKGDDMDPCDNPTQSYGGPWCPLAEGLDAQKNYTVSSGMYEYCTQCKNTASFYTPIFLPLLAFA